MGVGGWLPPQHPPNHHIQSGLDRTSDKRLVGLMVAKAKHGERWRRAFLGDPEGARCCDAPPRPLHSQQRPLPSPGACRGTVGQQPPPASDCDSQGAAPSAACRAPMKQESGCLSVTEEEADCPSAYLLTQLEQEVILEMQVCSSIRECAGVQSDQRVCRSPYPSAPCSIAHICCMQPFLSAVLLPVHSSESSSSLRTACPAVHSFESVPLP